MQTLIFAARMLVNKPTRHLRCTALATAAAIALCLVPDTFAADTPPVSAATTAEQAGLVDVSTLIPDISLDIRYAGERNFVGVQVDCYNAARCLLLEPAARALAQVEADLRAQHYRLRIYDCYRPARAVAHFVRWVQDPADQRTKALHYPNLDKSALLGEYIAPVSGHSRGATVDLTLLDCRSEGACVPVDMGTEYDFFDPRANTDAPDISPAQQANRQRLLSAMRRHGFGNYPKEWWHYTLTSIDSKLLFDIPID